MSSSSSPSPSSIAVMSGVESRSNSEHNKLTSESTSYHEKCSNSRDNSNYRNNHNHNNDSDSLSNALEPLSQRYKSEMENKYNAQLKGSQGVGWEMEGHKNLSVALPFSPHKYGSNSSISQPTNATVPSSTHNSSLITATSMLKTLSETSKTSSSEININTTINTTANTTTTPTTTFTSTLTSSPESFLSSAVVLHSNATTPELNRYAEPYLTHQPLPEKWRSPSSEWQREQQQHKEEEEQEQEQWERKQQHQQHHKMKSWEKQFEEQRLEQDECGKHTPVWSTKFGRETRERSHRHIKTPLHRHEHQSYSFQPEEHNKESHWDDEAFTSMQSNENRTDNASRLHWASPAEVMQLRNTCHALIHKHEHEVSALKAALRSVELEKEQQAANLRNTTELKRMYERSIKENKREKEYYNKWRVERELMNVRLRKLRVENEKQRWLLLQSHTSRFPHRIQHSHQINCYQEEQEPEQEQQQQQHSNQREKMTIKHKNNLTRKQEIASATEKLHKPFSETVPINNEKEITHRERLQSLHKSPHHVTNMSCNDNIIEQSKREHYSSPECVHLMHDHSQRSTSLNYPRHFSRERSNDNNNNNNNNNNNKKKKKEGSVAELQKESEENHLTKEHNGVLVHECEPNIVNRRSHSCPVPALESTHILQKMEKEYEEEEEEEEYEQEMLRIRQELDTTLNTQDHTALPESVTCHFSLREANSALHLSTESSSLTTPSSLHSSSYHNNHKNRKNNNDNNNTNNNLTEMKENYENELNVNETNNKVRDAEEIHKLRNANSTTSNNLHPSSYNMHINDKKNMNYVNSESMLHSFSESVETPSSLPSASVNDAAESKTTKEVSSLPTRSSESRSSVLTNTNTTITNSSITTATANSSNAIRAVRRTCLPDHSKTHLQEETNIHEQQYINQTDNATNENKAEHLLLGDTVKQTQQQEEERQQQQQEKKQKVEQYQSKEQEEPSSESTSSSSSSSAFSETSPPPFATPSSEMAATATNTINTRSSTSTTLSWLYHMPRTPAEALEENVALMQEVNQISALAKKLELQLTIDKECHNVKEQKWEYKQREANNELEVLRKKVERLEFKLTTVTEERQHLESELHNREVALEQVSAKISQLRENQHVKEEALTLNFSTDMMRKENEFNAILSKLQTEHDKIIYQAQTERDAAVEATEEAKTNLNKVTESIAVKENAIQSQIHAMQDEIVSLRRKHNEEIQNKVSELAQLTCKADNFNRELSTARSDMKTLEDKIFTISMEKEQLDTTASELKEALQRSLLHNTQLKKRLVQMEPLREVAARLEIMLQYANDELSIQKEFYEEERVVLINALERIEKQHAKEIRKWTNQCKEFAQLFHSISQASTDCKFVENDITKNGNANKVIPHNKSAKKLLTMHKKALEVKNHTSNNVETDKRRVSANANTNVAAINASDMEDKLQCDVLKLMQLSTRAAERLSNTIGRTK